MKPTEVYKILSKLKSGKATGLHMISNSVLKGAKDIIAPSMADIFKASIEKKIILDDFKTARVTPIFKCGEKEDLGNYRPISIISLRLKGSLKNCFINSCINFYHIRKF